MSSSSTCPSTRPPLHTVTNFPPLLSHQHYPQIPYSMHSPVIDTATYASMNGELLNGDVAQQYAQQITLGLHQDSTSTRSHSRSTEASDTSNGPTPPAENSQTNGTHAQPVPANPSAHLQNGNAQQQQMISQMPHLGMALQQATGIEPQQLASNFANFNNPDIFNFSNNSIIGYPVLGRMPVCFCVF
ncbi:unnamed protein product, partial [Mesorhabditis belari]|uniref:Uncharacterized protein n=1 Tax=Mesorhabditis belari TaxID=2138241 RepID=A0AAF3EZX3_9BILA